ncbi:MAG: hypothetical protein NT154_05360, partial [Verrucomicrobia bacterium]|nr:hypothetical protein [Verrucomicrobiota bacterium]
KIAGLLQKIRDEKLYRVDYATFQDYVRQRWQTSARRARQLIDADGVIRDLEANCPGANVRANGVERLAAPVVEDAAPVVKPRVLPATESQVRPLLALAKEERVAAWSDAVSAAKGTPTAKQVQKAAKARLRARWEAHRAKANVPAESDRFRTKQVLEAAQRAVVAIVALQDMVEASPGRVGHCRFAVREVEKVELDLKHGDEITVEQEAVWVAQDAAADLGGLSDMLRELGLVDLVIKVGDSLAALKPIYDRLKISNGRVDCCALERDELTAGKGREKDRPQ